MTFRNFVIKTIRANLSRYSIFISCITLAITVFFMYSTLWLNPMFEEVKSNQIDILLSVAGVITIIFALFLILYTHSLFLKSRGKEFSVLISYGLTYKELLKLIWLEGCVVYLVCLGASYVVGSVFSRLFFMISTSLLDINNVDFMLPYKSYLVTLLVFVPIALLSLILSGFKIRKMSVMNLKSLDSQSEFNRKGRLWLFILGSIFIASSVIITYFVTKHIISEDVMNWKILILIAFCLLGVYIFMKNLSSFIVEKRRKQGHSKKLIENANFEVNFQKNYRMYFIIALLSLGVVLFITVTFTLMNSSYDIVNKEMVYTIEYQEVEAKPYGDYIKPLEIARQVGVEDKVNEETLNFLYMNATNLIKSTWRTNSYIPVLDIDKFNKVFQTDYNVPEGEVILIKSESTLSDEIQYFKDTVTFEKGNIKHTYPIYQKHSKKYIARYTFPQPILILVNSSEYSTLFALTDGTERGILHLLEVDEWIQQKRFSDEFQYVFNEATDLIWDQDEETSEEVKNETGYRVFNYNGKYRNYNRSKKLGAFSLYIMSFVSLLFIFSTIITFYFNIYSGIQKDQEQFHYLQGIGITRSEGLKIIKTKVARTIFIPLASGVLLGAVWCYILNFHRLIEIELSNELLLSRAIIVGGIYLVVMYLYSITLSRKYFRAVW